MNRKSYKKSRRNMHRNTYKKSDSLEKNLKILFKKLKEHKNLPPEAVRLKKVSRFFLKNPKTHTDLFVKNLRDTISRFIVFMANNSNSDITRKFKNLCLKIINIIDKTCLKLATINQAVEAGKNKNIILTNSVQDSNDIKKYGITGPIPGTSKNSTPQSLYNELKNHKNINEVIIYCASTTCANGIATKIFLLDLLKAKPLKREIKITEYPGGGLEYEALVKLFPEKYKMTRPSGSRHFHYNFCQSITNRSVKDRDLKSHMKKTRKRY